ncbi:SMEK domain-containing protein [Aeromonas sp. ASNIH2]|uniref:SMEK domain-containing protein n=1 Tax=Aeromonas sp. ASNIH2 TaxID=1636607 RepID=UPI000CDC0E73|nr:SMEK domain-containing protein [Aeromonas sp. ASNIH2]AUY09419.1 hypothetical protein C3F36_07545 [Aeromonas sp. ASNIH2]
MKRMEYQQRIIKALSWLRAEVEYNNCVSLTDINHGAEDFYCGLLNLVYGYNLKNINIIEPNAAAIDLGDEIRKIAIQVTSTSTLVKTKHTVDKFIEKGLFRKFDKLLILNIVKKTNHAVDAIGDDNYRLDTKADIFDVEVLIKEITRDPNLKKLKCIVDFLDAELLSPAKNSLPNEVLTILGIIEYISDEGHENAGNGYLDEPIPEDKIFRRFADHADFLVDMYNDGYIEYGAVLDAVKNEADFGQVKLRRASNYLRRYSDNVLTDCSGDPKKALERIIFDFRALLGSNGYTFDEGAAEFYVIEQLVKCNIFPYKKEVVHA